MRHTSKLGALPQLVHDHGGRGEAEVAIRASRMFSDWLLIFAKFLFYFHHAKMHGVSFPGANKGSLLEKFIAMTHSRKFIAESSQKFIAVTII